ncbi:MAG: WYL domain-containing transcriptional regulator [Chloroflexia bacterium]|nr:WYL domain-containing transcriptional regulator [Chloroflexia bacterium]
MQAWVSYLADVPVALLRLIAASQRVSLSRRGSRGECLLRVRRALCRPAAVRAVYFSLSAEAQAAAQMLRAEPRTLSMQAVTSRYGPLRSLAALRQDRKPRSLAEVFVLAGWLLPRPASRQHPCRYVVPPEVRAWLPRPLRIDAVRCLPETSLNAAPVSPSDLLAVRAATLVLLAAAQHPVVVVRNGCPSRATLHRLRVGLLPLPALEAEALLRWVTPLLADLALLAPHGRAAVPAPAAAAWLAAPHATRVQTLVEAWIRAPRPEVALLPPRAAQSGVDWSALRRRLLAWAAYVPVTVVPDEAFVALTAAFGPLADATTHPFRTKRRPPWNRQTMREVWGRSLEGPLRWLGALRGQVEAQAVPGCWEYQAPGELRVAHAAVGPELLAVMPFAQVVGGDEAGLLLRFEQSVIARAVGRGCHLGRARAVLEQQAGSLPPAWEPLFALAGSVRLVQRTVVIGDQPQVLQDLQRYRAVHRLLETLLAPGVALVHPGQEELLVAQLARLGYAAQVLPSRHESVPLPDLTPAETATLLLASQYYQATAPAHAPLGPHDALLERLRAALPVALRNATETALAHLLATHHATTEPSATPPLHELPPDHAAQLHRWLQALREAIQKRRVVAVLYQGVLDPYPQERVLQPVRLERHGAVWYAYAYCFLAHGERCFRLDRVWKLEVLDLTQTEEHARSLPTAPADEQGHNDSAKRGKRVPRTGFFASPPPPSEHHPLVRVWLHEEE